MNLGSSFKNRFESLKARFNARSEQKAKEVVKKSETPKITTHKVDWEPPEMLEFVSVRECLSRAKMNRTRAHRQQLKKFVKKQKRMNKAYGRKS